ncbi:MAG: SH3 domain-containing protein [Bacteroidota bacterium]
MKYFAFLCLVVICWACTTESKELEQRTEIVTVDKVAIDSIRAVYAARMSKLENPFPTAQVLEVGKLNPVDEAPLDTMFFLLREDLKDAVARKDIFELLKWVDEDIKCSFGAESGLEGFIQLWGLDTPAKTQQSLLWGVLGDLLEQGGVFSDNGRRFTMPYTFATFPDQYDSFTHGAITGSGVRIRERPDLNAGVVQSVSYEIVKIVERTAEELTIGGETHPWVKVALLNGKEGFVFGKFVASPLDYRAIFEQKAGEGWRMTVLVAGD